MTIDKVLDKLLYNSLLREFSIIKFPTKGFFGDNENYNSIPYMTKYPIDKLIKDILIDAEDRVINENTIKICFSYPFNDKYIIEFKSSEHEGGFKRKDLVEIIINQYYKMYKEEEMTTKIQVSSMGERIEMGMLNRNATNGKYGIYGHDIDDLSLDSMILNTDGIWILSISS